MTLYSPPEGSIPTLEVPTLEGVAAVHLIGIGGAGMRNLARLLLARGIAVSGSDLKASKGLDELRSLGAQVHVGHDAAWLGSPEAVVVSSAIAETNPELREARRRAIPVWARQQALAALAEGRRSISVSGTHGKTTTTSMIAMILERAGLDPTYLIGGDMNESGSGARSGQGDIFLFEADESDGSFLLTRPDIAVVTNVEVDHVDFYPGGAQELHRAFADFIRRAGSVVVCIDDPGAREALRLAGDQIQALTYGSDRGNDLVLGVSALGADGARGWVETAEGERTELSLRIDGPHNLANAVAAIGVTSLLGVDIGTAADALAAFGGVHRRFELRGTVRGAQIYDDYGHTPTEMAVTLQTARRRRPARLIALVQPHRYTRVQALWRELGASVTEADRILVTDVCGAAQEPIPGVTGQLVVDGVRLADPDAEVTYVPHRREVIEELDRTLRPGDLVVTMGCGDVWMLGDAAIELLADEATA